MGLDIGDATIGVAVSDLMGLTAQGVTTIKRQSKKKDLEQIRQIIKEKQVNLIVSGLPKNMNGSEGVQAEKVREFCNYIENETGISIEFIDERLTSKQANNLLIEGDVSRKKRKQVIDKLAAVLILQSYLDMKVF